MASEEEKLGCGCVTVLMASCAVLFAVIGASIAEDEARVGTVLDHDIRGAYCDKNWGCYSKEWKVYVEYSDGTDSWEFVPKSVYDNCTVGSDYPDCTEGS